MTGRYEVTRYRLPKLLTSFRKPGELFSFEISCLTEITFVAGLHLVSFYLSQTTILRGRPCFYLSHGVWEPVRSWLSSLLFLHSFHSASLTDMPRRESGSSKAGSQKKQECLLRGCNKRPKFWRKKPEAGVSWLLQSSSRGTGLSFCIVGQENFRPIPRVRLRSQTQFTSWRR